MGFSTPSGSRAQLEGPEGGDLGGTPGQVEPPLLGRPDAVLGADAPAELLDQTEHRLVHPIVVRGQTAHVHVDVPVPDVSEQPGPGGRRHRLHHAGDPVDEFGQ